MRAVCVARHTPELEWHDADATDLDYTHLVHSTLTVTDAIDWSQLGLREGDIIANTRLRSLLRAYTQWRTGDLREIAHAHELSVSTRDTTQTLLERLGSHVCRHTCPTILVVFRPLQRKRTDNQVQRNRTRAQSAAVTPADAYTQVASDELRKTIIGEWQEAFTTEQFQNAVCGPCGRRVLTKHITYVSPSEFDLNHLRNNGLPQKVKAACLRTFCRERLRQSIREDQLGEGRIGVRDLGRRCHPDLAWDM